MSIYHLLRQKLSERQFEENLLFISIGIVSAVICSAYAMMFTFTEHYSLELFSAHKEFLFVMSPLGLVLSFLVVRWFSPGSNGSGIPQVMACIEPDHEHLAKKLLRKSVIVIKMLSSLIAVFVGGAIGREGPSLQISASVAYNLSSYLKKFNVKFRTEQVLVAGAASGLAAAFNTPIGGIVYAIEELSREHLRTFKNVLLLAVVIAGITAQLILGNYLYLGYPVVTATNSFYLLTAISSLGIICGMLGATFSKMLTLLIQWRANKSFTSQLVIISMIGIILATVFYTIGGQALYSGKEVINEALFSPAPLQWSTVFSRFFTPILTSMTGIAGGIFAPSLSAGSAIGGILASIFDPSLKTIFALAGMVAFLNGVTRTPITSFILVLEMTDRHSVVLPMMVAAVFSSLGARLISKKSFYEEAMEGILKTSAP